MQFLCCDIKTLNPLGPSWKNTISYLEGRDTTAVSLTVFRTPQLWGFGSSKAYRICDRLRENQAQRGVRKYREKIDRFPTEGNG